MTPAVSALRDRLSGRREGYWELLATALGDGTSVARTMKALSRDALARAASGPAISLSLVEQRVQALAAHNRSVLEQLTRDWKSIHEITCDILDQANAFWGVAWSSSLRFLAQPPRHVPLQNLPLYLGSEIDIVCGAPREMDLEEGIAFAKNPTRVYGDLRRVQLSGAESIDESALRRLLESETPSGAQLERLRIVQPVSVRLAPRAVEHLERVALKTWPDKVGLPHVGGFPILIHLVVTRGHESVRAELLRRLEARLATTPDPQDWLPFAYAILGTQWEPA